MDAETFLTEYPEFTGIDEAVLSRILDRAIALIDESVWASMSTTAIGLLAAHEIQVNRLQFLEEQQIAAGLQAGKIPVAGKITSYWDKTHYGQKYQELRKKIPRSGFTW